MTKKVLNIRVRIGPSPTGDPHVGTLYVALFNYAFAKKNSGKFILRIEDTDQKRSNKQSEKNIINSLKWFGLSWDEGPDIGGPCGPYRQSERKEIYKKYIDQLFKKNKVYWCTCSHKRLADVRKRQLILKQPTSYDGYCRRRSQKEVLKEIADGASAVVRLKTPKIGNTVFHDILRGNISISNSEIDDQVLFKGDGFPTYHLANVVDDHLMKISHILRGEEWISSTPKHILLYEFLGFNPPKFCHLPLLRNADKSKVSKRKNSVSISYYKQAGFLSDSLLNFLGLMAFSFKDGREMFSLNDFINEFSLKRISLGGPVFDIQKMLWLNGRYIREKRKNSQIVDYLQKQLFSDKYLNKIVPLVKDRFKKSEDFIKYADFFFIGNVLIDPINYVIGNKDKN